MMIIEGEDNRRLTKRHSSSPSRPLGILPLSHACPIALPWAFIVIPFDLPLMFFRCLPKSFRLPL